MKTLPTLVDVEIPDTNDLTVCGDVHGQYYDLLNIFKLNGKPSPSNPYLFNGARSGGQTEWHITSMQASHPGCTTASQAGCQAVRCRGCMLGAEARVLRLPTNACMARSPDPALGAGDFVDRGSFSVEVILTLFAYSVLYPGCVHLARGNHESQNMNAMYGFDGEVGPPRRLCPAQPRSLSPHPSSPPWPTPGRAPVPEC